MYIALEQPVGAHLLTPDHEELAVPVTLRYTSDDALAVHFVFPAWISLDEEEVTWTFARALLEEGLDAPAGLGTVHLRPHGPTDTLLEFGIRRRFLLHDLLALADRRDLGLVEIAVGRI